MCREMYNELPRVTRQGGDWIGVPNQAISIFLPLCEWGTNAVAWTGARLAHISRKFYFIMPRVKVWESVIFKKLPR